jgi:flagellar protein FliS
MTNEMKQEFTRKISQANKTELIIILYEMLSQYIEDANSFNQIGDRRQTIIEVRRATQCVDELIASLNLEYPLAINLFRLYQYIKRELLKVKTESIESNIELTEANTESVQSLDHLIMIVHGLHEAYFEIGKEDKSGAVMTNIQTVYAGMTYGKNDINENMDSGIERRGYFI